MKARQIAPGTYQLTFLGFCNCYLVREDDGFTLIDTALPGSADKIMHAARQFGSQICRILLTHAHADHIGSLDKLHSLMGKVDVAIPPREAPLLHKDLSLRPGEPQQKPKGSFSGATTRPTHTLTEDELYGSLRCIATPGHTPGHFSYLDERTGVLFAGDALVSIGGELNVVTNPPWFFPLAKIATWDKNLARASAQKLTGYAPKGFANGHGRYISDPNALTEALQRANK